MTPPRVPGTPLTPALADALAEARALGSLRGWVPPSPSAIEEAERLLALLAARPLPAIVVEPEGSIALEWEAGGRGWLRFAVEGLGELSHSAVIDGDDYAQAEPFGDALPGWADELLKRLFGP
jgi:hypothetical protein